MSDLKKYVLKRMENDALYAARYETEYECFKAGLVLKMLRLQGGMTQEDFAGKMNMKTGAVSRMENHAEEMRLSALIKAAELFGKKLLVSIE
jgi:DNA-binding XRE family transcriptional regulator